MKLRAILFVCTGNTCRSPMAGMMLKHMLAKQNITGIEIFSRGTTAWPGTSLSPGARETLEAIGITTIPHEAKRLEKRDLERADLVLVMTEAHQQWIESVYPEAKAKVRRLGSADIQDPLGGSPTDYEKCRIEIQNGLLELFKDINSQ
jgi:protein-tyrosine-phosphatase